jgi:hypothetical protein
MSGTDAQGGQAGAPAQRRSRTGAVPFRVPFFLQNIFR